MSQSGMWMVCVTSSRIALLRARMSKIIEIAAQRGRWRAYKQASYFIPPTRLMACRRKQISMRDGE